MDEQTRELRDALHLAIANELGREVLQSIADSEPCEDSIAGQELLEGTEQEGLFALPGHVIEQHVAMVVENALDAGDIVLREAAAALREAPVPAPVEPPITSAVRNFVHAIEDGTLGWHKDLRVHLYAHLSREWHTLRDFAALTPEAPPVAALYRGAPREMFDANHSSPAENLAAIARGATLTVNYDPTLCSAGNGWLAELFCTLPDGHDGNKHRIELSDHSVVEWEGDLHDPDVHGERPARHRGAPRLDALEWALDKAEQRRPGYGKAQQAGEGS